MDFIAALQHAIDTAVEDFYDATGFVINQSSDWNIDVEQIVASGSSAGRLRYCRQSMIYVTDMSWRKGYRQVSTMPV